MPAKTLQSLQGHSWSIICRLEAGRITCGHLQWKHQNCATVKRLEVFKATKNKKQPWITNEIFHKNNVVKIKHNKHESNTK